MRRPLAALSLALAVTAGQVHAGGMAEPILEEEVEQQAAAGSRAGILVPILALVLLGIAVSNGGDDPGGKVLPTEPTDMK
ncbi:MAG: hypothetical protein N2Z62_06895 [Rhodobacteraceae bacterium]|nr:hypothetical protein [Paracoccaceae bacterium]